MTEPVILLGTQSNGETLPVQVDAFGRLVAEGMAGSQGPEGPPGPEGPEGPPGADGQGLPAGGGSEGYVLTWRDGKAIWAPPASGPSVIWSDYLESETGNFDSGSGPEKAFDGDSTTGAYAAGSGALYFAPPSLEVLTLRASFETNGSYPDYRYRFRCAGVQQEFTSGGRQDNWFNFTRFAGLTISNYQALAIEWLRPDGSRANGNLSRLEVNGVVLMDEAMLAQKRELTRSSNPQSGVITSTDIDLS